jgi:hypothetical protein
LDIVHRLVGTGEESRAARTTNARPPRAVGCRCR